MGHISVLSKLKREENEIVYFGNSVIFNMYLVQCSAWKIQSDTCVRNLLLTRLISREKDRLLKE